MALPNSDFTHPPLIYPLTGLNPDEMDLAGESKRNIDVTNEQGFKVKGTLNYLAGFSENKITDQEGVQHVVLSQRMGDSGVIAGETVTPWRLTASGSGSGITYKVDLDFSSITNGTNGNAIDLTGAGFDADTSITSTKYIVLEAGIVAGVASNWIIASVDEADGKEVGLDEETPPSQNKIRLRIGKVTIVDGTPTVIQSSRTCQIMSDMFLNGLIVKGFTSHPFNE
jgi:hypothetical protein